MGFEDAYLAMVGGPSHSVHGNWQDLLEYHLNESENGFAPELNWHRPRPQALFAIGLLALAALKDYIVHLVGDDAEPVIAGFHDLEERQSH